MTDYVINTFTTQRLSNMDVAIQYYRQKTDALLNALASQATRQLGQTLQSIESVEESFNQKLEEISANMGDLEAFYNKKIKGRDLQRRIAEYQQTNDAVSKGLEEGFNTIQFLQMLQGNKAPVEVSESGLPETINLSAQAKVLETMAQKGYSSAAAAGGARARLVGEITEQVITEMAQSNLQDLFSYIQQSGTVQTRNFSGLSQGKSDLLIATVELDLKDLDTKETVGVVDHQEIELDLIEAIDLEDKDARRALDIYSQGARGTIGGMTIKQWSDKMLGTSSATFAHSSYTMNLVNERYPNKAISQGFSYKNTFRQYTAYIISKFLINVIGVYNILVGNATGIETTASWLEKLKTQNYMLEHVVKLENSIYTAKDTVQVGKAV